MAVPVSGLPYDWWHAYLYLAGKRGLVVNNETIEQYTARVFQVDPMSMYMALFDQEAGHNTTNLHISSACARGPFQFLDFGAWTNPNATNFPGEAQVAGYTDQAANRSSCTARAYFQDLIWPQMFTLFQRVMTAKFGWGDMSGQFSGFGINRVQAQRNIYPGRPYDMLSLSSLSPDKIVPMAAGGDTPAEKLATLSISVIFEHLDQRVGPILSQEKFRAVVAATNNGPAAAILPRPIVMLHPDLVLFDEGAFVAVPQRNDMLLGPPPGYAAGTGGSVLLQPSQAAFWAVGLQAPTTESIRTLTDAVRAMVYAENAPLVEARPSLDVDPGLVPAVRETFTVSLQVAGRDTNPSQAKLDIQCIDEGFIPNPTLSGGLIEACTGSVVDMPVTVTNMGNQAGQNVVLRWEGGFQVIGTLEPGEAVMVTVPVIVHGGYQTEWFAVVSDNAPVVVVSDTIHGEICEQPPSKPGVSLPVIGGVVAGATAIVILAGQKIRQVKR